MRLDVSLDMVKFVDRMHHSLYRQLVLLTNATCHLFVDLLTSIKHGVEFSYLVGVTNALK